MAKNFLMQESKEYCAPVCEVINLDYDSAVLAESVTDKSTIRDWEYDDDYLSM